jgi:hypothetical protein
VSKKPIYGSVDFAANYGQTNAAMVFYYVFDESQGTGKGYDRLYIDLNRDLDLSNDPVVKPQRSPPDKASLNYAGATKQQVLFDLLTVNFDFGPAGTRPVQIMPRLGIYLYEKKEYRDVTFLRTCLYEGEITLGSEPYTARLGDIYVIHGRLDLPSAPLLLTSKDKERRISWWGSDELRAAHKVHGHFFTFSASPTGEQLTVTPYQGDFGTFEIGPGGRAITNLSVAGSLEAKELIVPVGGDIESGWPNPAPRCQLPVGDYLPHYITVQLGRLSIGISHNYHSEGKRGDRAGNPRFYGLTIRKDRRYVLDFSNKPDVMFASPARDQRFKPGDAVEVRAVLVDPKLDFMIRDLEDTTRKQTKGADGKRLGYERNLSLDPKVLITRANGKKVAEGVMPFG